MKFKLVVTDIDGVWTDGGMYYDETGGEIKKFHTYDSAGVLLLQRMNIPLAICTGETSQAVVRRAQKLGIQHIHIGVSDKLLLIQSICDDHGISMDDVAYLGDDLNDISALRKVGISACPSSAPSYIKEIVSKVMVKRGGEGVFREFVEWLVGPENVLRILEK